MFKWKKERNPEPGLSSFQRSIFILLRMAIGWHFLYEGLSKVFSPGWSATGYLLDSKGIFSELFISMASNESLMNVVNFLNIWGLTAIGLGLIVGAFTRFASWAGILLLLFYYLSHPALIGVDYLIPSEGNYFLINKTLVELIALWLISIFPTGKWFGIDSLFCKSN